jgi:histidinol phosphatase-like enzyme (inositol monophosphatase family)
MPARKSEHERVSQRELLASAHLLADTSGPAILKYFRKKLVVEDKGSGGRFDPVTVADKAAERAIRRQLRRLHPDHAILGEEEGFTAGSSPITWDIDPIDGTRAFMTGMPLWGTLIGVTFEGRAIVGMMDQPYTAERIWSADKAAYWRNAGGKTQRLRSTPCRSLADARFTTTSPDLFVEASEKEVFARVRHAARMTRFGGDCYAYCLLAAGHVDVIIEAGLKPYDIVALVPIIEGAGGVVTSWTGSRPEDGGRILATGDPRLHEKLLKITSQA